MGLKPNETVPEVDYSLRKARGIGTIILIFFIVIWVFSLTGGNLFLRWSIEQSMFETETGMNDGRWLVNLVCGVFLFIPLLALYFAVKIPRVKLMLRLWATAAAFVLLSGPAKFLYLTSQIQSYLLLSGGLILMSVLLLLLKRKDRTPKRKISKSTLAVTSLTTDPALIPGPLTTRGTLRSGS